MANNQHDDVRQEELPVGSHNAHEKGLSGRDRSTLDNDGAADGRRHPKWAMGILNDKDTEEVPGEYYNDKTSFSVNRPSYLTFSQAPFSSSLLSEMSRSVLIGCQQGDRLHHCPRIPGIHLVPPKSRVNDPLLKSTLQMAPLSLILNQRILLMIR